LGRLAKRLGAEAAFPRPSAQRDGLRDEDGALGAVYQTDTALSRRGKNGQGEADDDVTKMERPGRGAS